MNEQLRAYLLVKAWTDEARRAAAEARRLHAKHKTLAELHGRVGTELDKNTPVHDDMSPEAFAHMEAERHHQMASDYYRAAALEHEHAYKNNTTRSIGNVLSENAQEWGRIANELSKELGVGSKAGVALLGGVLGRIFAGSKPSLLRVVKGRLLVAKRILAEQR